jgi:hypothetical protein
MSMDAGLGIASACYLVEVTVSEYGSGALQFKIASAPWLTNYAFGSHLVDWLALAVVVVLTFAARIGARRLVFRLLAQKRDKGKGEKEYWRVHGGE